MNNSEKGKPINFVQGSEEWHTWRDSGIGASESAVIIGLNPFENVVDLWKRKVGLLPRVESNQAMLHGQRLEEPARKAFIDHVGIPFTPICVEHPSLPWMRASLDGINNDWSAILEIKCPFRMENHLKVVQGTIASYYFCQMQHQLAAAGAQKCYFWSYTKSMGGHKHEIHPNERFIKNLIEREQYFWQHVIDRIPPNPAEFTMIPVFSD